MNTSIRQNGKQRKIFGILTTLTALPKVHIYQEKGLDEFYLRHDNVFVPDFGFAWDQTKEQYKVYIHVASKTADKTWAGYCICTIASGLTATGFCGLYSFLHKHRANNKEASFA